MLHLISCTISARSEFQARSEVKSVALNGVANIEVVYPAGVKVEMALTNLRRINNYRADAEGTPNKPVEPVS